MSNCCARCHAESDGIYCDYCIGGYICSECATIIHGPTIVHIKHYGNVCIHSQPYTKSLSNSEPAEIPVVQNREINEGETLLLNAKYRTEFQYKNPIYKLECKNGGNHLANIRGTDNIVANGVVGERTFLGCDKCDMTFTQDYIGVK